MFWDKLLEPFHNGYQEFITDAAHYHYAASFLREQMKALPGATNPAAKEAYEDFLRSDSPVQKQFRILDQQVSPLLQDVDVAKDWYDLVPVWFRVNNRIRDTLSTLSTMQKDEKVADTVLPQPKEEAPQADLHLPSQTPLPSKTASDLRQTPPETIPSPEQALSETAPAPGQIPSKNTVPDPALLRKQNRAEQLSRLKQSGKRTVTLLSGAAGTGKTFLTEERIRYLTDRLQIQPESILMLAPTREKAELLLLKYHLELELPISLAQVTEEDRVFTEHHTNVYTHILIDDLQHFTAGQMALIEQLAMRFPHAGWFCTVDDWQTIGGDYQAIYDFRRIFPQCEEEVLTRIYRHSEELAENAALFVMSDPLHTRKELHGQPCGKPAIHIVAYATSTGDNLFPQAIALAQELAGPGSLLLPIHLLQDANNIRQWFDRPLLPCTPDRLQDAEADSVIIPPSFFVRMDCPIIKAQEAVERRLPARERRLLYSALTRSRGCSIILTPLEYQSALVKELQRLPVKMHTIT